MEFGARPFSLETVFSLFSVLHRFEASPTWLRDRTGIYVWPIVHHSPLAQPALPNALDVGMWGLKSFGVCIKYLKCHHNFPEKKS